MFEKMKKKNVPNYLSLALLKIYYQIIIYNLIFNWYCKWL